MFKFNFTADDLELDETEQQQQQQTQEDEVVSELSKPLADLSVTDAQLIPAGQLDLTSDEFLRGLPAAIHYELAKLPCQKPNQTETCTQPGEQAFVTLYKRNLEDVKFQMALEDEDLETEGDSTTKTATHGAATVTGPGGAEILALADRSDLVKGVYEGGLKTWECALDLVTYLAENTEAKDYDGKKVLELGCGSALPGIYALTQSDSVQVDFQDYNDQVLRLVTLPNILLNTCTRPDLQQPSSQEDEESNSEEEPEKKQEKTEGEDGEDSDEDDEEEDELDMPEKDPADGDFQGVELDLPESDAEKRGLMERVARQSKLIRGDWGGFVDLMGIEDGKDDNKYDLILTSETIYAEENHEKLYSTIKRSLKKDGKALVAAKSFYFGVGGDILSFQRLIEKDGVFNVRNIFSAQAFVRREILELTFKQ